MTTEEENSSGEKRKLLVFLGKGICRLWRKSRRDTDDGRVERQAQHGFEETGGNEVNDAGSEVCLERKWGTSSSEISLSGEPGRKSKKLRDTRL